MKEKASLMSNVNAQIWYVSMEAQNPIVADAIETLPSIYHALQYFDEETRN